MMGTMGEEASSEGLPSVRADATPAVSSSVAASPPPVPASSGGGVAGGAGGHAGGVVGSGLGGGGSVGGGEYRPHSSMYELSESDMPSGVGMRKHSPGTGVIKTGAPPCPSHRSRAHW